MACFLDQIQIGNVLFPRALIDICYVKQIKQEYCIFQLRKHFWWFRIACKLRNNLPAYWGFRSCHLLSYVNQLLIDQRHPPSPKSNLNGRIATYPFDINTYSRNINKLELLCLLLLNAAKMEIQVSNNYIRIRFWRTEFWTYWRDHFQNNLCHCFRNYYELFYGDDLPVCNYLHVLMLHVGRTASILVENEAICERFTD